MTSHEETIRNLKSRQEEIDGIKAKLLEKYLGTFEKAGLKSDDMRQKIHGDWTDKEDY